MSNNNTKKLKILFVAVSASMVHQKGIIDALLRRGHQVKFLFDPNGTTEGMIENTKKSFDGVPRIEYGPALVRHDRWRNMLFYLREFRSYQRYLFINDQSLFYRDRWRSYLPNTLRLVFSYKFMEKLFTNHAIRRFLGKVENIIPPDPKIVKEILNYGPDIVLASPTTIRFSKADLEYLKASVHLGLPTAVSVLTWDNLTTKGLMHILPDKLLVWNQAQVEEAKRFHFLPEERIHVVGASFFDDWFSGIKLSKTRAEFCSQHGLKKEYPILLYLGTSANLAKDETSQVVLLSNVLSSMDDSNLRNTQIIVRPHPSNFKIYSKLNLNNVIILPKKGTLPDSAESLQLFYDTINHAFVTVVGVNTSGIIDAMIVGSPAAALTGGEYNSTQSNTLHFQQLVDANALYLIKDKETCRVILKDLFEGRDKLKENRKQFIKNFIRPRNLYRAAAEFVADEIEQSAYVSKK